MKHDLLLWLCSSESVFVLNKEEGKDSHLKLPNVGDEEKLFNTFYNFFLNDCSYLGFLF